MMEPRLLKIACLLLAGACVALATTALVRAPGSALQVRWHRYIRKLDDELAVLEMKLKGPSVAIAQGTGILLLACTLAVKPELGATVGAIAVAVAIGPTILLRRGMRRRVEAIEKDINPFLDGLANSLKASPSLGKALLRVERVLSGPLAVEIRHVTRDMRLGASVDQALLALGARVKSPALDSVLTAILIGRQVGGNLPKILETTATTLREMDRLTGVVRSKTAEGKAQVMVIALAPPGVFFAFEGMQPGYFDPFTANLNGMLMLAGACGLWLTAVVMAKVILRVDI